MKKNVIRLELFVFFFSSSFYKLIISIFFHTNFHISSSQPELKWSWNGSLFWADELEKLSIDILNIQPTFIGYPVSERPYEQRCERKDTSSGSRRFGRWPTLRLAMLSMFFQKEFHVNRRHITTTEAKPPSGLIPLWYFVYWTSLLCQNNQIIIKYEN